MKDTPTTREQFLDAARKLFAEKGFYGVSIAAVAAELGLTKQALLHHFGSKEKLYGCVLEGISDRFMQALEGGPDSLADAVDRLFRHMVREQADARIVMRELLDNTERAERSRRWYLRPFLDRLVALARQNAGWSGQGDAEIFARIYQIVGAVNYWAISGATLERMYGVDAVEDVAGVFPDVLMANFLPHPKD